MFDTSTLKSEQNKDKEVIPVVGVILMVAIAVILSAVVGSFVLDLGGSVEQNANAGILIDEASDGNVTFTLVSKSNTDQINITGDHSGTLSSVGDSTTFSMAGGDQVSIVAVSPSGEETVVQTYTKPHSGPEDFNGSGDYPTEE